MDVKKKLVVYSTLFGDYDSLIEPVEQYEGCSFVCFTDQKHLQSKIWEIRVVEVKGMSNTMMSRKYKWLPHKYLNDYEISLYIDCNIILLDNPCKLVSKYLNSDKNIAIPRHPLRNCIYAEAEACIERNKSSIKDTLDQILFYKKEAFPSKYGLSENNIIFRKHLNKRIIHIMEENWNEINKWKTRRDQLSLFYILWKNNYNIELMEENCRNENDYYFKITGHKVLSSERLLENIKMRLLFKKWIIIDKNIYKFFSKIM